MPTYKRAYRGAKNKPKTVFGRAIKRATAKQPGRRRSPYSTGPTSQRRRSYSNGANYRGPHRIGYRF